MFRNRVASGGSIDIEASVREAFLGRSAEEERAREQLSSLEDDCDSEWSELLVA